VSLVSKANPCSQRSTCSKVAKRHVGARDWPVVAGVPLAGVGVADPAWLAPPPVLVPPALAQATTAIVVAHISSRFPKPIRVVMLIVVILMVAKQPEDLLSRGDRTTLFAPRGPDRR